MGFGIIILGYILTLLDTFGGGIVGCPLMAYGFYRASRVNKSFSGLAPEWNVLMVSCVPGSPMD